jgi:SAM-dependent methyltransferase
MPCNAVKVDTIMSNDLFAKAFDANRQLWDERVALHRRDATGFYQVESFLAGNDILLPIEASEIGNVQGLRIAHLQCHFGMDSICLARRGASVIGLDFSESAIAEARRLAQDASADASFVHGNVYDARRLLDGDFDLVYTTWGTVGWLPDIVEWARVVASLLKPGGALYFADGHPGMLCLEMIDGKIVPHYDWRTPKDRPLITSGGAAYTGDDTSGFAHDTTYEWIHPVSDMVNALIDAGLRLEWLHEHAVLAWPYFPIMESTGDRMFRLPENYPQLPLSLSLRATKP